MEALFLLVPLSVAIVFLAAWLFLRMAHGGQFEDLDSPAQGILLDDDRPAVTSVHEGQQADPPTATDRSSLDAAQCPR